MSILAQLLSQNVTALKDRVAKDYRAKKVKSEQTEEQKETARIKRRQKREASKPAAPHGYMTLDEFSDLYRITSSRDTIRGACYYATVDRGATEYCIFGVMLSIVTVGVKYYVKPVHEWLEVSRAIKMHVACNSKNEYDSYVHCASHKSNGRIFKLNGVEFEAKYIDGKIKMCLHSAPVVS